MHQQKPQQGVKTLSIRIPLDLYLEISQYALDNDLPSLNASIINLVTSGLEVLEERDRIITEFILQLVPKEDLERIIDGE